MTALGSRWIGQLLERYDASGPDNLADGHRRNGPKPRLLTAAVLEVVRLRSAAPPPDGGLWSSREVADAIAAHLGLERVRPQRGWDASQALGYSLPRPKNPKSAMAEEATAVKKVGGRGRLAGPAASAPAGNGTSAEPSSASHRGSATGPHRLPPSLRAAGTGFAHARSGISTQHPACAAGSRVKPPSLGRPAWPRG